MRLQRKKTKSIRFQIYVLSILLGASLLIGTTFAWYTLQKREAETETGTVMKPYYLELKGPGETAMEHLSVGSLQQNQIRQIVFCVSSKEVSAINQDTSGFLYDLELIHTDNIDLKYEIYPLSAAENGSIIVIEEVVGEDGTATTQTTYWNKAGDSLLGEDVSAERHEQAGLTETDVPTSDIINRGTYIFYENAGNTAEGTEQYFVLEISWNISTGFDKYKKETDMIYLQAKAVQPEPVK